MTEQVQQNLLPNRLTPGESAVVRFRLPERSRLGLEDITPTEIHLVFDISNGTVASSDAIDITLDDDLGEDVEQVINITQAIDTARAGRTPDWLSVKPGINRVAFYTAQIKVSYDDNGTTATNSYNIDRGRIEILDTGVSTISDFDTDILVELRRIYRSKLEGRDDVSKYTVEGRSIETLTLDEIQKQINLYESRIARRAQRTRTWPSSHRRRNRNAISARTAWNPYGN